MPGVFSYTWQEEHGIICLLQFPGNKNSLMSFGVVFFLSLLMVLICISLMPDDVKHLFMCLFVILFGKFNIYFIYLFFSLFFFLFIYFY